MDIRGVQSSSFIDFPGVISTVLFTGGCNFRCGYCHNGDLVEMTGERISLKDVERLIESRRKYIKGVVITGGEPTLQKDLVDYIENLRGKGLKVKLDTNGTNPGVLKGLLKKNLLDYVAMDIKSGVSRYSEAAGVQVDVEKVRESIACIKSSGVDYEFRTTLCREHICAEDMGEIASLISGGKRYFIQNYRAADSQLVKTRYGSYSLDEAKSLVASCDWGGMEIEFRGF